MPPLAWCGGRELATPELGVPPLAWCGGREPATPIRAEVEFSLDVSLKMTSKGCTFPGKFVVHCVASLPRIFSKSSLEIVADAVILF